MRCAAWAATGPRSYRVGRKTPSSRDYSAPMRPSTSPIIAISTTSWRSSSYPAPTRCTRFMVTPRTSRAICARRACGLRRSRLRNSWRWRYERKPAGFPSSAGRLRRRACFFSRGCDFRNIYSKRRLEGMLARVRRPGKARPTGNARLAEGPARAQHGAPQVRVACGGIAQPRKQQVQPFRPQDGRVELHLFLLPSRAERAASDLNGHLSDGAAIQVAALGFGNRDPLGQIVEQLEGFVVLVQRSVAEHTGAIERQRRRTADLAAQAAPSLTRVHSAQSVYLVMVESSRRFSD